MTDNVKFLKDKEKFTKEIKSLIEIEDIVNEYIRRYKSFEKYYPEFKNFNEYLDKLHPKLTKSKKDKAEKIYNYEKEKKIYTDNEGHISNYYAPQFLGINDKLFKKIVEKQLIVPEGYIEFRKWGKSLKTPYFDYDLLYKIKHEKLEEFINKVNGFKNNKQFNDWTSFSNKIIEKYNLILIKDIFYRKIQIEKINKVIIEKIDIGINKENFKNIDIEAIHIEFENKIQKQSKKDIKIINELNSIFEDNKIEDTEIKFFKDINDNINKNSFFKEVNKVIDKIRYKSRISQLEEEFDLKNYPQSFKLARSIKRKIKFYIGPTNSGKTYDALEGLKKSNNGIYLAPLRLMALEAFEKLNEAGIPCNLITGEEHIIIQDAKHTAATIECLNTNQLFDCAVIDEIQMINDQDRGWAWTKALFGVAAKEVNVIGNEQALKHSVSLLENLEEEITVLHKERMSKLKVLDSNVSIRNLQKGDALIAFSKKQVLRYARELKDHGKKVSIIYGALSPEVRKKQAHLFSSGENDILVSTDAIGMGLNLPINRVIFSTLKKYDGSSNRILKTIEVKQIAGRAGRANIDGFTTVLDSSNEYSVFIETCLNIKENNITNFPIMPNSWHVSRIKDILKTNSIEEILEVFPKLCNNKNFHSSIKEDILSIASIIDKKLKIPAEEKLKFCLTPVDMNSNQQVEIFLDIIDNVFVKNLKITYNNNFDLYEKSYKDLEYAEQELKCISIFCYLAKFTDNISLVNISNIKQRLNNFIMRALLKVNVPEDYINYRDYYDDYEENFYFNKF